MCRIKNYAEFKIARETRLVEFSDLREFITALEERGWLRRVKRPLSPELEIPEVLRQVMYARGPAVLFESVRGFPGWRVVGNIFGSLERIKTALGVDRLEDAGRRALELLTGPPPLSAWDKIKAAVKLLELGRAAPRVVKRGPVAEVVEEPNLLAIPAFRSWPGDAGRYITYGLLITRGQHGITNIGVYRVQILSEREAIVHAQIHKRAADLLSSASECVDAAIVLGGDPVFLLAGAMPVPYPLDEYLFIGVLRGRGVEVMRGVSTDLYVPARAEAVVEGCIDVKDLRREGPFGDHYGVYDPGGLYPVFRAESIMRRSDPIYYGTVVGPPPLEDAYIGKAVERVFLPVLQFLIPEVVDINLPVHGLFQGIAIVSIKKRYPGHGKKVMMALWGLGHMLSLTKIVIVVDHDINVHDVREVLFAIAQRVDPQRDVVIIPGAHTDALDASSPVPGYGSKLGIDATRKLPEEYGGRKWPEELKPDPDIARRVKDAVAEILAGYTPEPSLFY
jgi:4-hydroxy-3-polyprenylbenzoate decarboxylase